MKIRLSSQITPDSIVDGPGLRAVIWTQGCKHNCKGCHNPQTHDMDGGFLEDINEIKKQLSQLKMQRGITLSGGEPFLQAEQCAAIAEYAHSRKLNVWCFTGFTYEYLCSLKDEHIERLLKSIDVLVDGPFIEEEKSYELVYKGSKNQRILHLKNGNILSIGNP